jgi:hypothetical protein
MALGVVEDQMRDLAFLARDDLVGLAHAKTP